MLQISGLAFADKRILSSLEWSGANRDLFDKGDNTNWVEHLLNMVCKTALCKPILNNSWALPLVAKQNCYCISGKKKVFIGKIFEQC